MCVRFSRSVGARGSALMPGLASEPESGGVGSRLARDAPRLGLTINFDAYAGRGGISLGLPGGLSC